MTTKLTALTAENTNAVLMPLKLGETKDPKALAFAADIAKLCKGRNTVELLSGWRAIATAYETQMAAERKAVRKASDPVTAAVSAAKAAADKAQADFGQHIGKRVEALWAADGLWYPGLLVSIGNRASTRYSVNWNVTGEGDDDITAVAEIRLVTPPKPRNSKPAPKVEPTPAPKAAPKGPAAVKAARQISTNPENRVEPAPKAKPVAPADPKAARLELIRIAAQDRAKRDAAAKAEAKGKGAKAA